MKMKLLIGICLIASAMLAMADDFKTIDGKEYKNGGQRGLFHRGEPKSHSGEGRGLRAFGGQGGLSYPQLIDRITRQGMKTVRG
jgi:hypothetical protein